MRVLLADVHRDMRDALTDYLLMLQAEVAHGETVAESRQLLQEAAFDVVVTHAHESRDRARREALEHAACERGAALIVVTGEPAGGSCREAAARISIAAVLARPLGVPAARRAAGLAAPEAPRAVAAP